MDRTEFIVATAIILFVAFMLGWFSHWVLHRFARAGTSDLNELDRMARELHEAEESREEAILWAKGRENELQNRLVQTEAELEAAMEGLREARAEAEELRDYVERLRQP